MIFELAFFIIAVFLMTVFGGFIAYSWSVPLGIIGVFAVLMFLLLYRRLAGVEAQVSEEQRALELWRQEHRGVNFIIYIFALALAIGSGYFACEKQLAREFGKNESQSFSQVRNLLKPVETTLAGLEQNDKEIKNLCQQIKQQQEQIQNLGDVLAELRQGVAEGSQGDKKEKEAWMEKLDKTNQNLQSAIKEMEQLKTALSKQEKSIREAIDIELKENLEKIKNEIEKNRKAEIPIPSPAKPEPSPSITEEENKQEKEGEK